MDSNSQTIHNLIGEFEMKYWDKFGDFAMNSDKITEDEIAEWEDSNAIALPQFYKEILIKHDGVRLDSGNYLFALKDVEVTKPGIIVEYICLGSVQSELIYCDQDGNVYLRNKKNRQMELADACMILKEFVMNLSLRGIQFDEADDNRYIKKNTRRDAFVVFGLAMITIFMIFAPPKWIIYAFVFSMIVGTIVAYSDMWGKE